MLLVCIFDKVQGEYAAPVLAANVATAKRWFYKAIKSSGFEPVDFQLYKVADFDVKTAVVVPDYVFICSGAVDEEVDVLDE